MSGLRDTGGGGLMVTAAFFPLLLFAPSSLFAAEKANARELLVIVHPANPLRAIDQQDLEAIFTASKRFWPHGPPIVALNAPPHSDERVAFDRIVLGMDPDAVARFWVRQQVRGGTRPPRKVPSSALAARIVAKLENGIAYVRAGTPLAGVRVIAVVRNEHVEPAK